MRSSDVLGAAARAGMRVESVEHVPVGGHFETVSARLAFDNPWQAAALLSDLADQDAEDPIVADWALAILRACVDATGSSGPTISAALQNCFAQSVHKSVQDSIRFIHEPGETFQSARVTMARGAGDCDDHARLVHALNLAAGNPSRLVYFDEAREPRVVLAGEVYPDDGSQPVHVVAQVGTSQGPAWSETTVPARFAEEPYSAYRRLVAAGIIEPTRDDLA